MFTEPEPEPEPVHFACATSSKPVLFSGIVGECAVTHHHTKCSSHTIFIPIPSTAISAQLEFYEVQKVSDSPGDRSKDCWKFHQISVENGQLSGIWGF